RVDPLRPLRYVARRLDRLRVQNRRSGLRRTARRPADLAAQRIMDRLGDTFLLPHHRVPGGIQRCEGGADGHRLACADLTGHDAEAAFADAPADAGDGFGMSGVPVQHLRRQRSPERGLGESVVGLQLLDHADAWSVWLLSLFAALSSPAPGSGSWPRTCPSGTGSSGIWSSRSWEYCTRSASSAVWCCST